MLRWKPLAALLTTSLLWAGLSSAGQITNICNGCGAYGELGVKLGSSTACGEQVDLRMSVRAQSGICTPITPGSGCRIDGDCHVNVRVDYQSSCPVQIGPWGLGGDCMLGPITVGFYPPTSQWTNAMQMSGPLTCEFERDTACTVGAQASCSGCPEAAVVSATVYCDACIR